MSYEMNGQNVAYPPPAPTTVAIPPRSRFSKWWPISFFIAAVVFFIIGGGLMGAWSASAYSSCYNGDYYDSCITVANDGEFYGGVACVVIGGVCKLIAWILLIIYCVKRTRPVGVVAYTPLAYAGPPAPPAAPIPYQPAPTPHPKEQPPAMGTMRYCANCGAAVTAPFCSQCGAKA